MNLMIVSGSQRAQSQSMNAATYLQKQARVAFFIYLYSVE
jgi:NAD(P)H-dependent FMN reductase